MTAWMDVAESYLGTTEAPGDRNNPKVVEMFALSGFSGIKTDSTAWCAAFVGPCSPRRA